MKVKKQLTRQILVRKTFWEEAQLQSFNSSIKHHGVLSKVGCEERPERRLEGSRAVLSLETKEPGLHPEGDGRLLKGFRQESNLASFVL